MKLNTKQDYSRSSLSGHSRKRTGLLTAVLIKPRLTLAHTNSVFTDSRKRSAPVADTFLPPEGVRFREHLLYFCKELAKVIV